MPVPIYYFDLETRAYTNRSDSLTYGDPMPENATEICPPYVANPDTHDSIFDGEEWHVVKKGEALKQANARVAELEAQVATMSELEARIAALESK